MIGLPELVWNRLSWLWIGFFILSGVANIYVAFNYDTDTWVNFKLFGLMAMTIVFIILQGVYINRHMQDVESAPNTNDTEHSTDKNDTTK